jgi:cholesterol transport system auxiliary component
MNKAVVASLAAIFVAACGTLGQPQAAKTVFDFGPPAERLANAVAPAGVALEVQAPGWIDTPRLVYRLAYQDAAERREYAASRWAGPAAGLLAQRLRQRLGLAAGGGRCVLRLGVEEFAQVFAAPDTSQGILRLDAQFVDARGRIAARFLIAGEAPAPSADARGGVAALRAAVDRSGVALNDWLAGPAAAPLLAGCA